MKVLLLILSLTLVAFAGDRVSFADDRYSLDFPQGWKKGKAPNADAEFARESPDKSVLFAVSRTPIPDGTAPDLDATAKDAAKATAKAFQFDKEASVSKGTLDGCDSRFVILTPEDPKSEGSLGVFVIFVNAKKDLLTIRAIMATPITEETNKACLGIIHSFRREDQKAKDPE